MFSGNPVMSLYTAIILEKQFSLPPVSLFPVYLLYYSHERLHFWSPNVWDFFPHTKQLSVTSTGYPAI